MLLANVRAARSTSSSKSRCSLIEVRPPTAPAKPQRITSVRRAEPPASRQRIGTCLGAENVACAADRMEEARLIAGFQLPSEVGHEDFDRVGRGKRVIAPDLFQQALARDHDALVAHEVFQQLE